MPFAEASRADSLGTVYHARSSGSPSAISSLQPEPFPPVLPSVSLSYSSGDVYAPSVTTYVRSRLGCSVLLILTISRSSAYHESGAYVDYSASQQPASYYQTTQNPQYGLPYPSVRPSDRPLVLPTAVEGGVTIRESRPKPQCWDHGCNGRQFSTFSNLLRHQREKSGQATKSYCPRCGAEFTRTTARNGHMAHEKCKSRRSSDSSRK